MIILEKPSITLKQYYLIKSIADKKKTLRFARRFQSYNNALIDEIIENEDYNENSIYPAVYYMTSGFVSPEYQRILRNHNVESNLSNQITVNHAKKKHIERLSDSIWKQVKNNASTVRDIVQTHDVDKSEYNRLKNINSKTTDRMGLIRKSIEGGIKKQNLNDEPNYKQLENIASNYIRQTQMVTDYEEALLVNETAEAKGLDPPITSKRWEWSALDNTRHSNMDEEVIPLEDYFDVLNEISVETDQMLYPKDPAGSDGNVINCECGVTYFGD